MTTPSPTAKPWTRFLTRQLPGAVVALALAAEGLAWMLDSVPLRRHDLDLQAQNVLLPVADPPPSIALLGDSVTHDVMMNFAVGRPGQVANLTTNKASGLVGAYLLLKRYLASNPPVAHLVIASTPSFFAYVPSGETARVYVSSVFRRADEKAYLNAYLSGDPVPFEPAALQLDKRIGLKLQALFAPGPSGLTVGPRQPDPAQTPAPHPISATVREDIVSRGGLPLEIPAANVRVISDLCRLIAKHGIALHIRTAPVAQGTWDAWAKNGRLTRFIAERQSVLQNHCAGVKLDVDPAVRVLPDGAMRDADHLIRHDWTNVYAVDLDRLVKGLAP